MEELKNKPVAESTAKNIFVFDLNKCVGCQACSVACMIENGIQKTERWRNIFSSNAMHLPGLPLYHVSLACNHCDDAPCMKNCPAKAFYRDEVTGAVIHQEEKCIGCKYCTWACPFDAPKYDAQKGVIEKCTFCNHRISDSQKPACATHCPTGALNYDSVPFTRVESDQSSPLPVKIGSRIRVFLLRNTNGPVQDLELLGSQQHDAMPVSKKGKISAGKEWTLMVFSILLAWVVSVQASDLLGQASGVIKYLNLFLAGCAALISFLHLGNKFKSWRAVLNFKHSWLSREIVLFSLFILLMVLHLFLINIPTFVFLILGMILLFAVDKIYDLAKWKWKFPVHDAQILFIGVSVYLFLKGFAVAFAFVLAFRILLMAYHVFYSKNDNRLFGLFRMAWMLTVLVLSLYSVHVILAGIVFMMGELFNRIDFYNRLSVASPQNDLC